ncbi:CD1375 family protein [Propionispora vibrioides]|nr:CD1375 family protein [Propionispora vibrioides]
MEAYMIKVYAFLVKNTQRKIETLPQEYQTPVAEYLAAADDK